MELTRSTGAGYVTTTADHPDQMRAIGVGRPPAQALHADTLAQQGAGTAGPGPLLGVAPLILRAPG